MLQESQTSKERTPAAPVQSAALVAPEADDLQPYGNAAAQDLLSQQSAQPVLGNASSTYTFPQGSTIQGTKLASTGSTTAHAEIYGKTMEIKFAPAFLLDSTWPLSNVAVTAIDIDVETGNVVSLEANDTQTFAFGGDGAHADIRAKVSKAVQGVLGQGREIADPYATMSAVMGAIVAPAKDVSRAGAGGHVTLPTAIVVGDAGMPAGTTLTLAIGLSGDKVDYVTWRNAVTLEEKGQPVVNMMGGSLKGGGSSAGPSQLVNPPKNIDTLGAGVRLLGLLGSVIAHGGKTANPAWVDGYGEKAEKMGLEKASVLLQALAPELVAQLKVALPHFDWSGMGAK